MTRTVTLGTLGAPTRRLVVLAAATAVLGLAACGAGSNPVAQPSGTGGASSVAAGPIVVGAADFSESQVLAEIYAQALTAKGIPAQTRPPIGSREIYLKALQEGSVQVMPEYTGSLLANLKKSDPPAGSDAVYAALKAALPSGLSVLAKSAAEDKDSIVVTKATADAWGLKSVADLAAHQDQLAIAAPPEFQGRVKGLLGLKDQYNVTPKDFRPLKGKAIVDALVGGQVQAANIFSTDPAIVINGLVTLEDPKNLFGSDNVVPLVRTDRVTPALSAALDAVSAKLDTASLTELLRQVDVDKKDAKVAAKEWLIKVGLAS